MAKSIFLAAVMAAALLMAGPAEVMARGRGEGHGVSRGHGFAGRSFSRGGGAWQGRSGRSFSGNRGFAGRSFSNRYRGGSNRYYGGREFARHGARDRDRDDRYRRHDSYGYYGAPYDPYSYGYSYAPGYSYDPYACGFYDQWGYWHADPRCELLPWEY